MWSSHCTNNVTFPYYFFRGHTVTLRQYILTILLLRYACRQASHFYVSMPSLIRRLVLPSLLLLFHIHCYDHCRQSEAPPATFSCRNCHAPTATFPCHHCSLPPPHPAETITPLLQYLNVITVTLYWAATFSLRHCHTPTATCARRHSYTCLSFLRSVSYTHLTLSTIYSV